MTTKTKAMPKKGTTWCDKKTGLEVSVSAVTADLITMKLEVEPNVPHGWKKSAKISKHEWQNMTLTLKKG